MPLDIRRDPGDAWPMRVQGSTLVGQRALGNAHYEAVQIFNIVLLIAYGENPTSGYLNYFVQSPIKIYPPQFTFFSDPPSGFALQVVTPFVAKTFFSAAEEIATLRVFDAQGEHDIAVRQASPVNLDLEALIESSSDGVIHVHGNVDDVKRHYDARRAARSVESRAYYERSLGRWVDPFTPPQITTECVKWCSITPWDKWCCGTTVHTQVMRVEAVLTVTIAQPADIEEQIEIALRDAAVVGALGALTTALATGGTGAAQAFVASFSAAFEAKLATLIQEKIVTADVVFRTEWGPL